MQKYLLSWHNLECYVSRIDITDEYLEAMSNIEDRVLLQEKPLVRRSAPLSLIDEHERVEIAMWIVQMAVAELLQYSRHKAAVECLLYE